jgi:hypothetical protein
MLLLQMFSILKGDTWQFTARDSWDQWLDQRSAQDILKEMQAGPSLALKAGAQVALLVNMDVQLGLANGSRGVVVRGATVLEYIEQEVGLASGMAVSVRLCMLRPHRLPARLQPAPLPACGAWVWGHATSLPAAPDAWLMPGCRWNWIPRTTEGAATLSSSSSSSSSGSSNSLVPHRSRQHRSLAYPVLSWTPSRCCTGSRRTGWCT